MDNQDAHVCITPPCDGVRQEIWQALATYILVPCEGGAWLLNNTPTSYCVRYTEFEQLNIVHYVVN